MDLSTRLLLWQHLAESCGLSTLQQGLQQVWKLLLLCLLCRLCFRLGETPAGPSQPPHQRFDQSLAFLRGRVHSEARHVAAGGDVRPLPLLPRAHVVGAAPERTLLPGPPAGPSLGQQRPPPLSPGAPLPPRWVRWALIRDPGVVWFMSSLPFQRAASGRPGDLESDQR